LHELKEIILEFIHQIEQIDFSNESNVKILYNKAKEIAYTIFKTQKSIEPIFEFAEAEYYYNNEYTQNIIINNMNIGQIKVFNKNVTNKVNKKKSFVILTIDFDAYIGIDSTLPLFFEISKYPSTTLDYTLLVERGTLYKTIDNKLNEYTSSIILGRELKGIFIDNEVKKVTIRYTVGSNEKTLTSEELENFKNDFIEFLQKNEIGIID
jgi:phenylalanyl-tRNA synthetase beta chain